MSELVSRLLKGGKTPTSMNKLSAEIGMTPEMMNYIVHVDTDHRTVYFETPKVACTAVKAFMQEAATGKALDPNLPAHLIHQREHSPLNRLSRIQGMTRRKVLWGKEFSRFAFVRHPVRRFVSGYLDKFVNLDNFDRSVYLQKIGLEADASPSLLDVLERLRDIDDRQRDVHFCTQHLLLGSGKINFDLLGRFETFSEDLRSVAHRFYGMRDLDLAALRAVGGRHTTDSSGVEIGKREEDLITRIYEADFEHYGYSPQTEFRKPTKPAASAPRKATAHPGGQDSDPHDLLFKQSWFWWKVGEGINPSGNGDFDRLRNVERDFLVRTFIHLLEKHRDSRDQHPELIDFFAFAARNATRSKSQIWQDLWALHMTCEKREGFFVEFGACDGISMSNSLLLEQDYGWKGILAEPNPAWKGDLFRNRTATIDTDCVFARTGETMQFQCVVSEPELSRIATIVPDDVHERTGNRSEMELVDVPTVSLNDLLERHEAPREIDFMSVDTEGSEYEILKEFNFSKYDVHLFAVEHGGETEKRDRIRKLLGAEGYELWYPEFSRWDDWFFRSK